MKRKLTVCDVSGFHEVDVVFCSCYDARTGLHEDWQDLLRLKWYPATHHRPLMVFTFCVLDFFLELTHQGKCNLYDFHKTLDRISDNSGAVDSWVSLSSWNDAQVYSLLSVDLPAVRRCRAAMAQSHDAQEEWPRT